MSAPDAATVAAVLAEHVSQVGPISGAWHCPCGAVSSNGHIEVGNLTTRAERTAEFCAHLAAALLAAEPIAQALAAVARVEALRDQWQENYPGPTAACNRTPDEWGRDLAAALRPEGGNQ